MTPRKGPRVLEIQDVRTASVGRMMATLEHVGRQDVTVVDIDANGKEVLRGRFSRAQMGRQLGEALDIGHLGSVQRRRGSGGAIRLRLSRRSS